LRLAQCASGVAATVSARCNMGAARTSPTINRMAAPTCRTISPSNPDAAPSDATRNPAIVNDATSPAASASGARRPWRAAEARTIGTIGSTHGDKIVRAPAP
jgi:hypothetical protein